MPFLCGRLPMSVGFVLPATAFCTPCPRPHHHRPNGRVPRVSSGHGDRLERVHGSEDGAAGSLSEHGRVGRRVRHAEELVLDSPRSLLSSTTHPARPWAGQSLHQGRSRDATAPFTPAPRRFGRRIRFYLPPRRIAQEAAPEARSPVGRMHLPWTKEAAASGVSTTGGASTAAPPTARVLRSCRPRSSIPRPRRPRRSLRRAHHPGASRPPPSRPGPSGS